MELIDLTTETLIDYVVGTVDTGAGPHGCKISKDNLAAVLGLGSSSSYGVIASPAAIEATSIKAGVKKLTVLSSNGVFGEGVIDWIRVPSEPLHPYKRRSLDRYLADGSEDTDDGGWWSISMPNWEVSAEAIGFIRGSANKAANMAAFVVYQQYLQYLADSVDSNGGETIKVVWAPGNYWFSTLQVKWRIWWEGSTAGFAGIGASTKFIFEAKKGGIVLNRHNTLGPLVTASDSAGADGSIIRGIYIEQDEVGNKAFIPYAFGIWVKVRAEIIDCGFNSWGNASIAVFAASDSDDALGNANGYRIINCTVVNSPAPALWCWGADANAGESRALDAVNCPFAIKDDSFLGSVHYNPQWAGFGYDLIANWNISPHVIKNNFLYIIRRDGSGQDDAQLAGAHINPPSGDATHNDWWVCIGDDAYEDDENLSTAEWGRVQDDDGLVYDAQPGQYANMWTTKPTSSATVWGTGSAPTPGVNYIQWGTASAMINKTGDWADAPFNIGPYAFAGAYHLVGAWPQLIQPYQEGETACCHVIGNTSEVQGGNLSYGPDSEPRFRRRKLGLVLPSGKVLVPGNFEDPLEYEAGDIALMGGVYDSDGFYGNQATVSGLGSVVKTSTIAIYHSRVPTYPPDTLANYTAKGYYPDAGARGFITDSNATLAAGLGNIVDDGGANGVPVYGDGTNWRIG
jgi:hypothetical protein